MNKFNYFMNSQKSSPTQQYKAVTVGKESLNEELGMNESVIMELSSIATLVVSVIVLIYAVKSFLLKVGYKICCNISIASSIECEDKYISRITLENKKDRAAVIFKIYFKLGNNNYLLIEDFSDEPLILGPFEVYQKLFDPIIQYECSLRRIKLNNLLNNYKLKRRIVLSTTKGKHTVKASIRTWDTAKVFFKNPFIATINPKRLVYREKAYGSNVKFLVIINPGESNEEVVAVHKDDWQWHKFKHFKLTKDCLASKDKLEEFLEGRKEQGDFGNSVIEVIDFEKEVHKIKCKWDCDKNSFEAENLGFFEYELGGRLYLLRDKWKNKRKKKDRDCQNHIFHPWDKVMIDI